MSTEFKEHPIHLFGEWFNAAQETETSDPDAACLATVDQDGLPNARVILVRHFDDNGFCFFTNYDSTKGQELITRGKAALNFHWKSKKRQVRIRGTIEKVSSVESDEYYNSRPLGNRIGAWASKQSHPLESRDTLINRVKDFEDKFGETPPRPEHWGGFRLIPQEIEFWEEGEFRLHNRKQYKNSNGTWVLTTLYP
ncbi:MAG TPA: pyridoxamine 5'-phosphate oxidase [Alphaproteobacteria bacterium]|nr:pyridoxamine 5'-phosphate oxidase [Alphaproteobacteria bacterium]HOO51114.1 pyridoxamine 5'-phosphate oxidase [Alphaproteobacteria bacterium]